jgi:hypothetical protein
MPKSIVKTGIPDSWASQLIFQDDISMESLNNSYVIKNKISFALIKHPSKHTGPMTNDQ